MMTFHARPFNKPAAPSHTHAASAGQQANQQANKAGDAAGADFAALLTETWSTPLNPDAAAPAEEAVDAEAPATAGTDEQPAMPVAMIGPPVEPAMCRKDDDAATPAPGGETEAAPVVAFSITNLFTDKPFFRTGAETANAGDGTTAETNLKEVSTGTEATASPVASDSDEAAGPALATGFKPLPKTSPEPKPMPVTPADPAPGPSPGLSFNGILQRNPVLRPFPRVPQNELTTGPRAASAGVPSDFAGAHYSPYSDVDGAAAINPTQTARATNVFTILGIAKGTDGIEARPASATEQSGVSGDAVSNQGEKSGKASLLETMFREVARVAAESQAQAVAIKDAMAPAPRNLSSSLEEHGNGAETGEPAGAAPGVLTTGHATSPRHMADAPTSADAPAIAKQIISPLLEMARDLTKRETRSLRLQLRPDEFGQINLQITRGSDGRLSAQLAADLSGTQQALAGGIEHLRQTLEHAGLVIDRLEVNLALDLQGKGGSHTSHDEAARTAYGQEAKTYAAEPVTDAGRDAAAEQRRLLNLRI